MRRQAHINVIAAEVPQGAWYARNFWDHFIFRLFWKEFLPIEVSLLIRYPVGVCIPYSQLLAFLSCGILDTYIHYSLYF
jgi:hypothetical protein